MAEDGSSLVKVELFLRRCASCFEEWDEPSPVYDDAIPARTASGALAFVLPDDCKVWDEVEERYRASTGIDPKSVEDAEALDRVFDRTVDSDATGEPFRLWGHRNCP